MDGEVPETAGVGSSGVQAKVRQAMRRLCILLLIRSQHAESPPWRYHRLLWKGAAQDSSFVLSKTEKKSQRSLHVLFGLHEQFCSRRKSCFTCEFSLFFREVSISTELLRTCLEKICGSFLGSPSAKAQFVVCRQTRSSARWWCHARFCSGYCPSPNYECEFIPRFLCCGFLMDSLSSQVASKRVFFA